MQSSAFILQTIFIVKETELTDVVQHLEESSSDSSPVEDWRPTHFSDCAYCWLSLVIIWRWLLGSRTMTHWLAICFRLRNSFRVLTKPLWCWMFLKTKELFLDNWKHHPVPISIAFGSQTVKQVQSFRYIGTVLNSSVSFSDSINIVCR